MSAIYQQTLHENAAALAGGELSAVALMEAVAARAESVEDRVAAFIHRDREDALAQARASDERRAAGQALGPLDGIPVGIKDVLAVAGQPLTCGSRMLRDYVSPYDATCIRKLRAAGAVLWGRLNMDEFAMGSTTESSAFYPTRNPWDTGRSPGGSSGGSAASVAAGSAIASLGTDTGGSVRQPASYCGVVGLKPTYGRISRYGLVAYASSLDQVGPCTRTVDDAAVLLDALCGHDPLDSTSLDVAPPEAAAALAGEAWQRPLRIGVPAEFLGAGLDPELRASLDAAIAFYKAQGWSVEPVSLPHADLAVPVYYLIATAEASSNLARFDGVRYTHRSADASNAIDLYSKSRAEGFGAEVKRRILLGTYVLSAGYYDAYYLRAQKIRSLIRADFEAAFEKVDVILGPTAPTAARELGAHKGDPLSMYLEDIYTIPVNLAGLPALSFPSGFTGGGLPVGLQFIGRPLEETSILAAAKVFEAAHDFHLRSPSL